MTFHWKCRGVACNLLIRRELRKTHSCRLNAGTGKKTEHSIAPKQGAVCGEEGVKCSFDKIVSDRAMLAESFPNAARRSIPVMGTDPEVTQSAMERKQSQWKKRSI